ncbi:MAG: tyrosine-type recombinase/integrase, partial [Chloroflexales bacterium]|nr:tyrosine-type recombinase/integrase [Chloroflexales bacterium]
MDDPNGLHRLLAQLLYGSGLCLLECLRLRVNDLDFTDHQITVRDGKDQKDCRTMLPARLIASLQQHLHMHQDDLRQGYGAVLLPDALARKCPNVEREWRGQSVFPSPQRGDPPPPHGRERTAKGGPARSPAAGVPQAGDLPHRAPSFR